MSDMLGTDIAVDDGGDFIIDESTGDFAGVEGLDCLLSDIRFLVSVPTGSLIDAPYAGAHFSREVPTTDFDILKTTRAYETFLKNEPRIKPDSILVSGSVRNGIPYFTESFKTIDEQTVDNLIL
jgi:hypothetical protein